MINVQDIGMCVIKTFLALLFDLREFFSMLWIKKFLEIAFTITLFLEHEYRLSEVAYLLNFEIAPRFKHGLLNDLRRSIYLSLSKVM